MAKKKQILLTGGLNQYREISDGDFPAWTVMSGTGGGSSDNFTADFTANPAFGKYSAGQTVPANGKTPREVLLDAFCNYLPPAFSSFASSLSSVVEVGETVSGNVNFTFGLSNAGNVRANTLSITDNTAPQVLVSAKAVVSPIEVNIGSVKKTVNGATNSWKASVVNSQNQTVYSGLNTVTWLYKKFHGAVDTDPTDSTAVRALTAIWNTVTSFSISLNKLKYAIVLPTGKNLVSVITQNNENITGNFVLTTVDVTLPDGSLVSYNCYVFTSALIMNINATVTTN